VLDAYEMRRRLMARKRVLEQQCEAWLDRCDAIAAMLMPWRGPMRQRHPDTDATAWQAVIDDVGWQSLFGLVSGLTATSMNPSHDWFAMRLGDADLDNQQPVRQWFADATSLVHRVFQRSNVYEIVPRVRMEQAAFGLGAALVLPDPQTIIRLRHLPAGEYFVAEDAQERPDTLYRDFRMSVVQVVQTFGLDKCSKAVRQAYDKGSYDDLVHITHVIEPRRDRDPRLQDQANMPWRSLYFEHGDGFEAGVLREGGFKRFPAIVSAWDRNHDSPYGHGPGVYAYRAIQQLQAQQIEKGRGIAYQVRPPLGMDTSAKGQGINLLPGGISYVGSNSGTGSRALFESRIDLTALREDMMEVRNRIRSAFHVDLFRMFSQDDRSGVTALEIAKRFEEKLTILAPVAQRAEDTLQEPLIALAFHHLAEVGLLPPPPPEIANRQVEIQFLGMLAAARMSQGVTATERFLAQVASLGQVWPDAYDLVNIDEVVAQFGSMLQVQPRLLRRPDEVAEVRMARQRANAAREQAEMASVQAGTAKDLAAATPTEGNLLGRVGEMAGAS